MQSMKSESTPEEIANSGLVPQLGTMIGALWAAPVRNTLFVLSGALFIDIAATAYGQNPAQYLEPTLL
jgi:hypothetical protein